MTARAYHPPPWTDTVLLSEAESHHLSRVLRLRAGDGVELFDGEGASASARICEVTRKTVSVDVGGPVHVDSTPVAEVVLAVAPPKGDRLRTMIEKVTELGVDRVILLKTSRSVVHPGDHKIDRLEQTALAACKQSGRNRLPKLEPLCPLEELSGRIDFSASALWIGDPQGPPITTCLADESCSRPSLAALIGPEGGFSPDETELARTWEARPVALSPHTLRVETAAIAMASWLCAVRQGSRA